MARTFRRQRTAQPIAELNVTNLIDLGFTLLIIFMIATPLIQQEQSIPINLPVAPDSSQAKPDPNTKFETVTLKADGTYLLGDRPLSLAQLDREFANFAALPKPPVIELRSDAKVTADVIFGKVWPLLIKHKLKQLIVDTKIAEK